MANHTLPVLEKPRLPQTLSRPICRQMDEDRERSLTGVSDLIATLPHRTGLVHRVNAAVSCERRSPTPCAARGHVPAVGAHPVILRTAHQMGERGIAEHAARSSLRTLPMRNSGRSEQMQGVIHPEAPIARRQRAPPQPSWTTSTRFDSARTVL